MAYISGTAETERDLLQKLNTFLTSHPDLVDGGENWKQIYTKTDPGNVTKPESLSYVWTAPGSTSEDEIFVGCKTYGSITNDIYNLYFSGGTYFNPVVANPDIFAGLVNSCEQVGVCADARVFKYWFFANSRRVIVVTSISGSVYSSAYCGFMLPNTTPDEYPYPLVIAGGINSEIIRYSDATITNSSIMNPRSKHMWLCRPDTGWYDFYGASVKETAGGGTARYTMPLALARLTGQAYTVLSGMSGSPDNHYPLMPIELYSVETAGTNFWGTLDSVYWVPGMSRAAEDIIQTIDNRSFIIFQNAFRTTTTDFFAVELA